ncbi:putative leucine-rich repeat domain superfamily [Helianthus annuus]|uniref:Leucine-rich repeat domain superfamily n=2 Tax=Helianthus annuus TaxID=4232 RepID=A0A9K3EDV7_HELAN|nr:putative leucine-rich repeat domain superfamily [Helianthus annuus]KAJ0465635.1 putative leucine-rich repeat domain superfamily [Helianthus annuus]KAJ0470505.1 putative leucine-rich repeat domain superfamily [Helianthus annuus]KAJ0487228.1 putative leucine-rich repeat domain superfamily [Helianthus annuus]KAJ0661342.1 putative leucine-rich repeat domain superfamily [Helianthus annuus]
MAHQFFYGKLTTAALMKFPLLEELNLYKIEISKEEIETVGRYCPMLKTLKVNQRGWRLFNADEGSLTRYNEIAMAIGQNLLGIRHLELIGNKMTNLGLRVILDNCHHLETLDLRQCFYIDLKVMCSHKALLWALCDTCRATSHRGFMSLEPVVIKPYLIITKV